MNRLLFTLLLLLPAVIAAAQNSPTSTYRPTPEINREATLREKLVQLALQNPNYEVSDRRVSVAEYQLRRAKGSWLGMLSASGNLNELSIKGNSGGENNLFFPRYNFNIGVPLDFFSAKKNDVKVARENLYIAEAEKNMNYRQIRREVLSKYEDYLMHKEKLELQTRMTQAEYTRYKLAEKDFEDNVISAEVYNKAEVLYFDQQMIKLEMQRNFNVTKLELEEMIGISIDDVLAQK